MNRREFQIGPGAASLLLIAVVLCMGVLGALSLVSARGDARLSQRGVELAEASAQLNLQAERSLSKLDEALAGIEAESDEEYLAELEDRLFEGAELDERVVRWTESTVGGRMLDCGAEIAPLGEFPRVSWVEHRMYTELEEDDSEQLLFPE